MSQAAKWAKVNHKWSKLSQNDYCHLFCCTFHAFLFCITICCEKKKNWFICTQWYKLTYFIWNIYFSFRPFGSFLMTNIVIFLPCYVSSVVVPNTLNLDPDPDPGFWPNLDPDPDPGISWIRIRIHNTAVNTFFVCWVSKFWIYILYLTFSASIVT